MQLQLLCMISYQHRIHIAPEAACQPQAVEGCPQAAPIIQHAAPMVHYAFLKLSQLLPAAPAVAAPEAAAPLLACRCRRRTP